MIIFVEAFPLSFHGIPDEKVEILRDNCNNLRDKAIIDFLLSTGIRVGELVRLNIDDIDFSEREYIEIG